MLLGHQTALISVAMTTLGYPKAQTFYLSWRMRNKARYSGNALLEQTATM